MNYETVPRDLNTSSTSHKGEKTSSYTVDFKPPGGGGNFHMSVNGDVPFFRVPFLSRFRIYGCHF